MRGHNIENRLFDEVHSCIEIEWKCADMTVPDNDMTARARVEWEKGKTYESTMRLVNALCFQLRYRESLELCEQLLVVYPNDYDLNRRLAVLNFKLLKFERSMEYLKKCLNTTHERLHILYMLGVVSYYAHAYLEAIDYLNECLPLCADNGEMYVAALFWRVCCELRVSASDRLPDGLFETHKYDCGHHTGYDLFIRFVNGELNENEAVAAIEDDTDLNKTCLYYGMSVFWGDDKEKARYYLDKTLAFADYFGGYAYIAGYADRHLHGDSFSD